MSIFRATLWSAALLLLVALALAGFIAYRVWPREFHAPAQTQFPRVVVKDHRVAVVMPTQALVADFGPYGTPVDTFLYLDLLRGRKPIDSTRVMTCHPPEHPENPRRIYLSVDNDIVSSLPYLYSLIDGTSVRRFALASWTTQDLNRCKDQTVRFEAIFRIPVSLNLQSIPDVDLINPLADFLVFKSATDRRILQGIDPDLRVLNQGQAQELAQDMIVVARFYALPLEYFMGIGAVENNYMDVRGDLGHTVWKRRPQRGDIILKRRRGSVLVENYSLGVWQITRETLRRAQALYLEDRKNRDYSLLPERLRPEITANPDDVLPETLTTYAGLLFRTLLDHFNGNIILALGAYNGGVDKPNLVYGESVRNVATYARVVLTHAIAASNQTQ